MMANGTENRDFENDNQSQQPTDKPSRGHTPKQTPAQAPACNHETAQLGAKFCPQCGEPLPALPLAAIDQRIEDQLRRHGLVDASGQPLRTDSEADQLKQQWQQYQAAVRKDGGFFGKGSPKFDSFESFSSASLESRQQELQRWGVVPAQKRNTRLL